MFATRTFESPHTEGGFVLLRDIAVRAAMDCDLAPAFFSSGERPWSDEGIRMLPGMRRLGWGFSAAVQYLLAISSASGDADVVHTAHVPTGINCRLLALVAAKARRRKTRFVQTVTALPFNGKTSRAFAWGDAITCINPQLTEVMRRYHGNVRTIPPIPFPRRLQSRAKMPAHLLSRIDDMKVVCCPVELSRLIRGFPLAEFANALVAERSDVFVVFTCRFGEEAELMRRIRGIRIPDRTIVVGTVEWILDLLSRSHVVVYPMDELNKKFNPPLILIEAASLGARIVAPSTIALDGLLETSTLVRARSTVVAGWVEAVEAMLGFSERAAGVLTTFEDTYQNYKLVYAELR